MFQFGALGVFCFNISMKFPAPAFIIWKKKSPTECNYEIYDKKMLTIIRCLEKWDLELRNVKFEIRTDHKNLEYFITVKKLTERQIKWSLIFLNTILWSIKFTNKNNERTDVLSKRAKYTGNWWW